MAVVFDIDGTLTPKVHPMNTAREHAAQTAEDRKQPAAFKTALLNECIDRGWTIEYAYGDSSTDFEAYAAVGIPQERVFALQREGDTSCQPGEWSVCLGGWTEQLEHLRHSVAPATIH